MTDLTVKQKHVLDKWLIEHNHEFGLFEQVNPFLLQTMENIRNTETLPSDIERYLSDKAGEYQHNRKW